MPKFYGSVNDLSELTVKLYGGVETITTASGQIRAEGAGNITLFDGTRFVNNTVPILDSQAIDFLKVTTVVDPFEVSLIAHFTDGTSAQTIYTATTTSGLYSIAQYGVVMRNENFVSGDDYVDVTPTYQWQARKITAVYGPSSIVGYVVTAANPAVVDVDKLNAKYYQKFGPFGFKPYSISRHVNSIYGYTQILISDYSSTNVIELFRYTTGEYNGEGEEWGFSSEPVVTSGDHIASLTSSSDEVPLAKRIF